MIDFSQDDFLSSTLNHLKNSSEKEIFQKLQKMAQGARANLYSYLDEIDISLTKSLNHFLKKLLPELPKDLVDRWVVASIVADAADIYQGQDQAVLTEISRVINRKLSTKKPLNWSKFAEEASLLFQAQENLYEIKAFPDVDMTSVYLSHFYKTLTSQDQLNQILDKTAKAYLELTPELPNTGQDGGNPSVDIDKILMPEFQPNYPVPNQEVIRQAIKSWNLIPDLEINRLLSTQNRELLTDEILEALTALKILRDNLDFNAQERISLDQLVLVLRQTIKRQLRLIDYVDYSDPQKLLSRFE